jgi:hypothetical protein
VTETPSRIPDAEPAGDALSRSVSPAAPRARAVRSAGTADPEPTHEAPARPSLVSDNAPPVLIRKIAPFSVRLSQFFWVASIAVGVFTLVYYFVIRQDLLPLIADRARLVSAGRPDGVYDSASDIIFWTIFAVLVATVFLQVVFLVSFMSRRPRIRWWQLATLALPGALVALTPEWVALGEPGVPIQPLLAAQTAVGLVALLLSVLPGALRWSARQHDIRRGPESTGGPDF